MRLENLLPYGFASTLLIILMFSMSHLQLARSDPQPYFYLHQRPRLQWRIEKVKGKESNDDVKENEPKDLKQVVRTTRSVPAFAEESPVGGIGGSRSSVHRMPFYTHDPLLWSTIRGK